mgnify:FL=1
MLATPLPSFVERLNHIINIARVNVATIYLYWMLSPNLLNLILDSRLTSLDFDPNAELMATIRNNGILLITGVDINNYLFHLSERVNFGYGNSIENTTSDLIYLD